jgi:hypothetical protein
MKIAVTGHTFGLGAEFVDFYRTKGHEVIGFSRSNGFDLRDWSKMHQMIDQLEDVELFISNAKPDFVQTLILYNLIPRWANTTKQIVSIGSQIINTTLDKSVDIGINLYKTQKHSLQHAFYQLNRKYPTTDSILIHPGHLYDYHNVDRVKVQNWILKFENIRQFAQQNNYHLNELYLP